MSLRKTFVAILSSFLMPTITAPLFLCSSLKGEVNYREIQPSKIAEELVFSDIIGWQPVVSDYDHIRLTISGPRGVYIRRQFESDTDPFFKTVGENGQPLPDGLYAFELTVIPEADPAPLRQEGKKTKLLRRFEEDYGDRLESLRQSGYFHIESGTIIESMNFDGSPLALTGGYKDDPLAPDAGIYEDWVTIGSSDPKLYMEDSDEPFINCGITGGADRWMVNGNQDFFQVIMQDVTGCAGSYFDAVTRIPFKISDYALDDSFVISSDGIGIGTATPDPNAAITIIDPTPSIEFEETGSGQKHRLGYYDGQFRILDIEYGYYPFLIKNGEKVDGAIHVASNGDVGLGVSRWDTPAASFHVENASSDDDDDFVVTDDSKVGIGTVSPEAPLHLTRSDSTVKIILAESTGPEAVRNMMDLKNNGMAQFRLIDTSPNGDAWQFSNTDNNLNISLQGSGSQEFLIENDGDVWINNGTVMVTSYRASKENFQNLDTEEILRRVADLPLSDWNYKKDNDSVRHIGPVSEDFYEFFGYGEDDQHIAPNDLAGVNTAAIQGLYQRLLEKDQEIQRLRGKVFELESLKQDLVDLSKLVADIRMGKLKN